MSEHNRWIFRMPNTDGEYTLFTVQDLLDTLKEYPALAEAVCAGCLVRDGTMRQLLDDAISELEWATKDHPRSHQVTDGDIMRAVERALENLHGYQSYLPDETEALLRGRPDTAEGERLTQALQSIANCAMGGCEGCRNLARAALRVPVARKGPSNLSRVIAPDDEIDENSRGYDVV